MLPYIAVQNQNAVTAYLKSKQLLHFGFAEQYSPVIANSLTKRAGTMLKWPTILSLPPEAGFRSDKKGGDHVEVANDTVSAARGRVSLPARCFQAPNKRQFFSLESISLIKMILLGEPPWSIGSVHDLTVREPIFRVLCFLTHLTILRSIS